MRKKDRASIAMAIFAVVVFSIIVAVAKASTCYVTDYSEYRAVSYETSCEALAKQEEEQEKRLYLLLGGIAALFVGMAIYAKSQQLTDIIEREDRLSFKHDITRNYTDTGWKYQWTANYRL